VVNHHVTPAFQANIAGTMPPSKTVCRERQHVTCVTRVSIKTLLGQKRARSVLSIPMQTPWVTRCVLNAHLAISRRMIIGPMFAGPCLQASLRLSPLDNLLGNRQVNHLVNPRGAPRASRRDNQQAGLRDNQHVNLLANQRHSPPANQRSSPRFNRLLCPPPTLRKILRPHRP